MTIDNREDIVNGIFFSTFVGEYVDIVSKLSTKITYQDEEGGVAEETSPMGFSGYLMDEDHLYYYLGEQPHNVTSAIKKSQVAYIRIAEQKTLADEILDSMPEPKEEDMN